MISKKLLFSKSPLEEIFINFPFSIFPISLNFESFSDTGAITLTKSISMFLFRFANLLSFFFCVRILGKLLASNLLPFILIVFPNKIVKSLFSIFSENVLIDIFLRFKNLPFLKLRSSTTIELLPSL